MFHSEDGCLHLLFANEDHYYLNSLVKLDLWRFIYYKLKKEKYKGIFFVQDLRSGFVVKTEDAHSAELYRKGARKILGFQMDAEIKKDGRHYCIEHRDEIEMTERILRLFKEADDCYAIVTPIQVFYHLFADPDMRVKLTAVLQEQRQRSIFLITAPVRANDSIDYLLDPVGVFNSEICPEMAHLLESSRRFLVYAELRIELGRRYQVWNQMKKEDIRRMLVRGLLLENWRGKMEFLEDYTAFIHAWHHSAAFAGRFPGVLQENEWWSMKKLEAQFSEKEGWKKLDRVVMQLRKVPGWVEKLTGENRFEEAERDPMLAMMPGVARLDGIDLGKVLMKADEKKARELRSMFQEIRLGLLLPWSDKNANNSSADFCVEQLKMLALQREPDILCVEKIIELLKYSVYSSEREQNGELFREKIGYYEHMIQMAMEAADKRVQVREEEKRLAQEQQNYQLLLEKALQEIEKDNGGSVKGGNVTGEMLKRNALKKELINTKKSLENREKVIGMLENGVGRCEQLLRQFETAIRELHADCGIGAAAKILEDASRTLLEQKILQAEEERACREAQDRMSEANEKAGQLDMECMGAEDLDMEYEQLISHDLQLADRRREKINV